MPSPLSFPPSLSSSPCHDCGADTVAAAAVVLGRSGRVQYSLIGRSAVGPRSGKSCLSQRHATSNAVEVLAQIGVDLPL